MSEQLQTSIHLEPATLYDVSDIVNLHYESEVNQFAEVEQHPQLPTRNEIATHYVSHGFHNHFANTRKREIAEQAGAATTVARLGAQIVGFSVYEHSKNWLTALYIATDYQRAGIGSLLLGHLLAAAGNKPTRLQTVQHTPAVAFYTKHGFTVQDTVPTEQCPRITATKRLPLVTMRYDPIKH